MKFNQDIELMLSKFSHELRNPLTTLYSTVQLIESKHPEAKSFHYWSTLTYDIESINQLLDEFSSFAKSEHLNLTTFDFRIFLEQLSLSFAASIAHSNVTYSSKIDSSIKQITGDKTKLQEVFFNLLKNAFEASQPNHSIFFTAYQKENTIFLSIKDTGCGISPEQLHTIFNPFVTYKKNGTGLGLSICKHIIEAHGGTITVSSAVDVGTTFTIQLQT